MSKALQKITKARANLVMSSPFFGTLALRMKVEEDPSVKLCSTDGTSLRYNPAAVEDMPLSKVVGMLAHTVMHPAMLHHTRRGDRDIARWNKACDYAINGILHSSGFDLPEGKFINPAYDGMPAEHIYTLIPPDEDDQKGNGNAPGDGNGGAPPPNTGNDPGGDGGVEDSPNSVSKGSSQSQQNHEEAEWKQTLAQATHAAKQAGRLPAGIERMMQELLQPVLPWKNILKRFMTEKCNDDFSWKRGNRRFVADDLYLPSRVSDDAMGTMVVAIDTSGSIGERELSEFGAEISDIHAEVKPRELIVIYCDAEVNHIDRFGPEDTLHFKLRGGGGTDFRPPFEWLTENQIVPRAFAYLTDGYGPFPETEPEFPNIWCINNRNVDPPYGEHIVLEV
jgi:predicted metal-dependent peptidase